MNQPKPKPEYRLYWPEVRRGWYIAQHAMTTGGTLVGLARHLRAGRAGHYPQDFKDCRIVRRDFSTVGHKHRTTPLPLP